MNSCKSLEDKNQITAVIDIMSLSEDHGNISQEFYENLSN